MKSVRINTDTPVVVTAKHNGQANFIVHLVGHGAEEFLFNQIGRFEGPDSYRNELDPASTPPADARGDWHLKGDGARVVPVHTDDDLQPVIRGTDKGQANFIVDVIGFGDMSGYFFIFNEIGRFKGEVLADEEMPAGDYLVWVQADGAWTLKFSP